MPLTASGRNATIDGGLGDAITHIGLAQPDGTEIAGGSPAYARLAVTWGAAASGVRDNDSDLDFNIPAGAEVARVLLRTHLTAGTDMGWFPVGGVKPEPAAVEADDDTFTNKSHGLSADDRVYVYPKNGDALPTGLSEGTLYYVVNVTTDTFKVSTSSGGSSVAITSDGECFYQECIPEVFAGQGVYSIGADDLDLDANLI